MQLANCHVRLGGDMANEIFKARVTPAEVLVLRHLHGPDSVVKLQPLGMDKRAHAGELDRLKAEYSAKVVGDTFPGAYPQLPVSFKDIGINFMAGDAEPPPAPRRGRKAADSAAQVAENAETEKLVEVEKPVEAEIGAQE